MTPTFVCPKCSRQHSVVVASDTIKLSNHYDGGVWCADCRDRWRRLQELQKKVCGRYPEYFTEGQHMLIGYRLRQDRLPK